MKVTVKTTGPHMVHDVFGGQTVLPGEDKPVELTPLIEAALADGRLEKVKGKAEDTPAAEAKPVAGAGPTSGAAAKGK